MYMIIPPGKPSELEHCIGLMGGHLLFKEYDDAIEASKLILGDYSNQFKVVGVKVTVEKAREV